MNPLKPEPAWQAAWIAALDAWSTGNLPRAFHFCQAASARGLASPELHGLMASIALGLEQYEAAKTYIGRAASRKAAGGTTAKPRYHVIQPWGCGFWGEVDHAIGQLAFAEIAGRIPIVHWGRHGTYPAPGYDNAWDAYFLPVSSARIDDLARGDLTFFPGRWRADALRTTSVEAGRAYADRTSSLHALSAEEDVTVADCHNRLLDILPWAPAGHWLAGGTGEDAYRGLFAKYLRPTPEIASEVDHLATTVLVRRPMLGVHFRAQSTSKDVESLERAWLDFDHYLPIIDRFVSDQPAGGIFLLTDLTRCAATLGERYGPRLRLLEATRLAHEGEIEVRVKPGVDLHAAAREVILDAYLATRCDFFLGDGASGVSCAVGFLKPWAPGTLQLLRANVALAPGRIQPT
ncbi:MAG: hypothetical protein EXQ95_11095 [Alphaproteobacteria bacterium]|nr:hypothetical protein [Alphaproteobacteria bacterium]